MNHKTTLALFLLSACLSINTFGQVSSLWSVEKDFSAEKSDKFGNQLDVVISIPWFYQKNGTAADSLNKRIADQILYYLDLDLVIATHQDYQKIIDHYLKKYEEPLDQASQEENSNSSFFFHAFVYEPFQNANLINICIHREIFEGGAAHGHRGLISLFFNPKTGRELTIDELFKDKENFKKIAEKSFRAEYEIPESENINALGSWFEDDIFALPKNIIIRPDTITLYYNLYEIQGYASGESIVDIPISEVKKFLKYLD